MMRVHIDGALVVECVEVAGSWNGWARPLFTRDQLDGVRDAVIRGGMDLTDIDGEVVADPKTLDMTTLDYVIKWGDLFEVSGWIWERVGEGN